MATNIEPGDDVWPDSLMRLAPDEDSQILVMSRGAVVDKGARIASRDSGSMIEPERAFESSGAERE